MQEKSPILVTGVVERADAQAETYLTKLYPRQHSGTQDDYFSPHIKVKDNYRHQQWSDSLAAPIVQAYRLASPNAVPPKPLFDVDFESKDFEGVYFNTDHISFEAEIINLLEPSVTATAPNDSSSRFQAATFYQDGTWTEIEN